MSACPQCSQPDSEESRACPHCGFDLATHRFILDAGGAAVPQVPRRRRRLYYGAGCLAIGATFGVSIWIAVQSICAVGNNVTCHHSLKYIGLALHAYHDDYGAFPPAVVADEAGRPIHSWRVLLLPYLDRKALYDRYRFDEPWDGPNNIQLLKEMPTIFACPNHRQAESTKATYLAVSGPGTAFPGSASTTTRDMTDGPSTVAMVGETTGPGVPWLQPVDIDVMLHPGIGDPAGFGSQHEGNGAHFLFGDGGVRYVNANAAAHLIKAMYTIDGGEAEHLTF